jgi:hypothetical protein
MLPKLKKSKLGGLLGVVYNICFQNMTLPCKISKLKLAENAARTPRKVMEDFCVMHRKFPANKRDR